MKLSIYRVGVVVLFISVLFPRAVPAGQHQVKRVWRSTDGDNPVLQPKTQELDQTQRQEQQQGEQVVIRFIRNPDPAPEFAVKGIDGSTVNLTAARGKVVLLNFWATWCGPCRMEVPDLVELQKKYQDQLQVIGLVKLNYHEDYFWAFEAPKVMNDFRIPVPREALEFSFEVAPAYCFAENSGRLPFGCHAWKKHDPKFWRPFLLRESDLAESAKG
jgi:thiol-disulfide isomerase/thioredoxin